MSEKEIIEAIRKLGRIHRGDPLFKNFQWFYKETMKIIEVEPMIVDGEQ